MTDKKHDMFPERNTAVKYAITAVAILVGFSLFGRDIVDQSYYEVSLIVVCIIVALCTTRAGMYADRHRLYLQYLRNREANDPNFSGAFVLYLRPFFASNAIWTENQARSRSILSINYHLTPGRVNIETALLQAVGDNLPFVAVGGDARSEGPGTVWSSDDKWKDKV